jgi:hypothetical protein
MILRNEGLGSSYIFLRYTSSFEIDPVAGSREVDNQLVLFLEVKY